MRTIRGLALGTYYAAGADAAKATPNASQMRGLVYAVKDYRDPPNARQPVNHPLHPARRAIAVDRTNAIEYVTAMLAKRIAQLTKFFGAEDPRSITLVPVPSSEVTVSTIDTARFRTLASLPRAGRRGSRHGRRPRDAARARRPQDEGRAAHADEILRGFVRTSAPMPRSTTIVLVDDNVQSGKSIAALESATRCDPTDLRIRSRRN